MDKIDLPEPIHIKNIHTKLDFFSKKGSNIIQWLGLNCIDVIFYLYLFNKYKSNCLIASRSAIDFELSLGLNLMVDENMSVDKKRIYDTHYSQIAQQIINCMKKSDVNNIIIPLYLFFPKKTGHANVLIYRKKSNEIEHFEPYGPRYPGKEQDLVEVTLDYFIKLLNEHLKNNEMIPVILKNAYEVCPYFYGFQTLEEKTRQRTAAESLGYCGVWSMFFTELALKNPTISSRELFEIVYNKVNGVKGGEYLKQIIRGYVNFISEKLEKYYSIIFNETASIDNISKIIENSENSEKDKKKFSLFRSMLNIFLQLEMELINNPSISIDDKINMLKRQFMTEHSMEKKNVKLMNEIKNKIYILNRMHVLKNPSPNSDEIEITPKTISSEHLKTTSSEHLKTTSSEDLETTASEASEPLVIYPKCPEGKVFDRIKQKCIKIRKTRRTHSRKEAKTKKIKDCLPGKERNPKTGRCKKIKTLRPCSEGQQRNPITRRCKKIKNG